MSTHDPRWEYPVLPYAGTSGWSGSETSRERAEREDGDGTTTARQRAVVSYLRELGTRGATYAELGAAFDWHHGQASGALSVLHKEGRIARLTTPHSRHRCAVYVHLDYIEGRDTARHGVTHSLAKVSDADLWAEVARREGWATLDPEAGQA